MLLGSPMPPEERSPMPPVRAGHPRMAFNPTMARQEAARLTRSPFWTEFSRRAVGHLDALNDTPRALTSAISHGGLLALASDDKAVGARVGEAVERLGKVVREGRWRVEDDLAQGFLLTDIAFGYDWAYLYLTPEQRKSGAEALVKLAHYSREKFSGYFKEGSYSAFNNHMHWNHVGVAAVGFATAGEHPDGQKLAEDGYRFFTQIFLPVFARFVGTNGIWNEGTHYNQVAIKPTFIWMDAARTALGKDFFSSPWVRSAATYWVYLTRADNTMTILGDWWTGSDEGTVTNLMARSFWITSRAAAAHRDPSLQAFAQRQLPFALRRPPEVWNLLWYAPDLSPRPLSELPPSRLFQGDPTVGGGATLAVLRSGREKDARLITLAMGDWLSHHGHYDSNAFTIHYKGDLAIDPGYSGEKDTDWTFYRRTSAHNSLIVPIPETQSVRDNPELKARNWGYDGGQRVMLLQERPRTLAQFLAVKNPEYPDKSLWETGDCLKFETHPSYDYVVGDATRAYHRSQLTRFVRHLVFLKPDIVVLYDVVETPDGRQPRWLLQSVNKPIPQGEQILIRNGGELRVRTLLPEKAQIAHVPTLPLAPVTGGKPGPPLTRTEVVSPPAKEHRFLHVLQITDADNPTQVVSQWKREGEWLRVDIQAGNVSRRVSLRWDGTPNVKIADAQ
jgi:hypothetical protein